MSSATPSKFILGTHMVGDSVKDAGIAIIDSEKDVRALLAAFHDRGYREIDTASNYGFSESRLGQANVASRFIIHTKIASGFPGSHTASAINHSIAASLLALRTDSVETMFLHVPDRTTPFEDSAKAMHEGVKQGKFRKWGLSNYTAEEVGRMCKICEERGWTGPSVYQGHYNAIVRGGERELFGVLRRWGMAFWAFSPAAGGIFSDGAETSSRWSDDNAVGKSYNTIYGQPPVRASVATVRDAARKHGISGHSAALRWTAFHSMLDGIYGDGLTFGISKIEQVDMTLDALEAGPLPEELAEAITNVYATVEGKEPPYHM